MVAEVRSWRDPRTQLIVMGLVLIVTLGATASLATFGFHQPFSSKDDSSADGMREAAVGYRQGVASGEVGEISIVLTSRAVEIGLSIDAALEFESGCLDWAEAELVGLEESVSPFDVRVIFADGSSEVTRWFSYEHHPGAGVAQNRWLVTLDGATC